MLVFLVVINLTIFITFLVIHSRKSDAVIQQVPEKPGMVLNKELALTPSQSDHVDIILADYRKVTNPVAEAIRSYRARILDELANDKPDTVKINHLTDSICNLQRQMQKASVMQYMALKKICNPDQCRRLSSLYFELYGFQDQGKGMGQGKGKRYQYRWGKKNNGQRK
ncbi:MAG: periplasmic heavy metal sensor [Bacteroidota bacterium]